MPSCLDEPDDDPITGRLEQFPEPSPWCSSSASTTRDSATGRLRARRSDDTRRERDAESEQAILDAAVAGAVEVGPDVYVLQGDGLWTPPSEVIEAGPGGRRRCSAPASRTIRARSANVGPHLLVLVGLFFLMVLPGLLAMNWFEARSTIDKLALVPGMSIVLTLLAGSPCSPCGGVRSRSRRDGRPSPSRSASGCAPRFGDAWLRKPLAGFGNFFNAMFAVFSNRDYAILDRCPVHGAGRPGSDPGRDRQVDRVRWPGGLRHPERAVRRLPAEGGPRPLRAVHAALPLRGGVHRSVRATPRRVVGEHRGRGDRRHRRPHGARAAGQRDVRGQHRRDGGARRSVAGGAGGRPHRPRSQVRRDPRRPRRQGPPAGQRDVAGRRGPGPDLRDRLRAWRKEPRSRRSRSSSPARWSSSARPWWRGRCVTWRRGRTRRPFGQELSQSCTTSWRVSASSRPGRRPPSASRPSRCSATSSGGSACSCSASTRRTSSRAATPTPSRSPCPAPAASPAARSGSCSRRS